MYGKNKISKTIRCIPCISTLVSAASSLEDLDSSFFSLEDIDSFYPSLIRVLYIDPDSHIDLTRKGNVYLCYTDVA